MDIDIVNGLLRLCIEKQTCHFELSSLCNYCLEQGLCTNPKYVLASVKNYLEIFKISRDKICLELFMPFEICRDSSHDTKTLCTNGHLCYDYFYTDSCRLLKHCSRPHVLTEKYHRNLLGPLITLDLDLLSKAFQIYCQSKKSLVNSRNHQNSMNHTSTSPLLTSRTLTSLHINGNSSWKTNSQTISSPRTSSQYQQKPMLPEIGVQICWKPQKNIQTHFIEVIFSNQGKSSGGPIQSNRLFQHLGVAQIFYENAHIAEQVVQHEPIKFQSFTFISRLLQRTADKRHVCLLNLPTDTNQLTSYIDKISVPFKRSNFKCYQNDQQTIIVEYDEDIDISRIRRNLRDHPECNGLMISCSQLFYPETLLVEYDKQYSEDDIIKWFDQKRVFHIKTYSLCCFVHFYSHNDLRLTVNETCNKTIRMTPIYIDVYTEKHLNDYLQQRLQSKTGLSLAILDDNAKRNLILAMEKINAAEKVQSSPNIATPPLSDTKAETTVPTKSTSKPQVQPEVNIVEEKPDPNQENNDHEGLVASEDDFHDLPSDFDNADLLLEDTIDDRGDMEYLRSAAKNLMTSLSEMEEAIENAETDDAPRSSLYGDDYLVTIKNHRFALAFLDYTQFRAEKQRNPDRFRLLAAFRKQSINKKCLDLSQQRDQSPSPAVNTEVKTNKKKRSKRNRKKKPTTNNDQDNDTNLAD